MHVFMVLLVVMLAFVCSAFAETVDVPVYDGYELVWQDEFNDDGPPDPASWTYEEGFVRNEELQWYQPENARCEDGNLVIEARRVDLPNPNHDPGSRDWQRKREKIEYTSACVKTVGLRQWLYGRIEVRAKIEVGSGLWPAIWMLGSARGWPGCGEIDIMEYYRGKILANAAWSAGEGWASRWDSSATPVEDLTDLTPEEWASQFHVWRMDWDEREIKLYIDGRLLNTIDLSKTVNESDDGANPFHEPQYILLNLAIGGSNGGDPSGTEFPSRYLIDYVRVYQEVGE